MSGKQTKRARKAMRAAGLIPRLDHKRAQTAARMQAAVEAKEARQRRIQEDPEGYAREQAEIRQMAQKVGHTFFAALGMVAGIGGV